MSDDEHGLIEIMVAAAVVVVLFTLLFLPAFLGIYSL
jgi:hypothetical protein